MPGPSELSLSRGRDGQEGGSCRPTACLCLRLQTPQKGFPSQEEACNLSGGAMGHEGCEAVESLYFTIRTAPCRLHVSDCKGLPSPGSVCPCASLRSEVSVLEDTWPEGLSPSLWDRGDGAEGRGGAPCLVVCGGHDSGLCALEQAVGGALWGAEEGGRHCQGTSRVGTSRTVGTGSAG